jgi:hypothetical protein
MSTKNRVKRSYTLTEDADKLLEKMADKNGISKSAALEIAIRNEAKNQGVAIDNN